MHLAGRVSAQHAAGSQGGSCVAARRPAAQLQGSTGKARAGAVFLTCQHSYPQGGPQKTGVKCGISSMRSSVFGSASAGCRKVPHRGEIAAAGVDFRVAGQFGGRARKATGAAAFGACEHCYPQGGPQKLGAIRTAMAVYPFWHDGQLMLVSYADCRFADNRLMAVPLPDEACHELA